MINLIGLQSGMVFQRDRNNRSDSYFTLNASGAVSVSAGTLTELESTPAGRRFHLTGLLTGGPYTLTLTVGEESETFTDLYVGDVWVLGGQSNMEGCGTYQDAVSTYEETPYIRFYSLEGQWKVGEPRVHPNDLSKDEYVRAYLNYPEPAYQTRGVGPGYYFARAMRSRTGVPQGLISCALGGSALSHWNPDEKDEEKPNLYWIMVRKFHECGGNAKGMFWYQGCSEAWSLESCRTFPSRMQHLVERFRADFNQPEMPMVQVQINRYIAVVPENDPSWNGIREAQRVLHETIPYLDTVSVTNAELVDGIHLSTRSQLELGCHAAESMYHLCFDPMGMYSTLAPRLKDIYAMPYTNDPTLALAVRYENLNGRLTSQGRPTGYAISKTPDSAAMQNILRVDLHNDTAYLRHEIPLEDLKNCYLFYFYGNNTYANITDEDGRSIPAMGPIALKDWLK